MNYIGSKFKLLPFLQNHIESSLKKAGAKALQDCIFCDLFAGSGVVGRHFKDKVAQIISNDREYYSFVLNQYYLANDENLSRINELVKMLNDTQKTPLIKGKIYTFYALGGGHNRQYFSDENAMRIDAIRLKIEEWKESDFINEGEYFSLLALLLESADKVANTACVYGAFLKQLKKSAQKPLVLESIKPNLWQKNATQKDKTHISLKKPKNHLIFNEDSATLISKIKGDILYLDPPYNAREYGANYHLLNTIALYDDFIPQGKTGLREYEKSSWCKKNAVANALEQVIQNANFEWIFLSYNDEGLLNLNQIKEILSQYGDYTFHTQHYQRFKADSKRIQKQDKTLETLHVLRKY